MKWLAILLMIANVALYLWMSGHQEPGGGQELPAKPEVNRSGMLLLSEMQRQNGGQPVAEVTQVAPNENPAPPAAASAGAGERGALVVAGEQRGGPASAAPAAGSASSAGPAAAGDSGKALPAAAPEQAVVAPITPAPVTKPEPVAKKICYRVGPFKEKSQLSAITTALTSEGTDYRVVQGQERSLKATRVYLGPFPDRAEADAMLKKVRTLAPDAYKYDSGGRQRVQLGYFNQEELARKYVVALQEKGLQAQTEQEFRTLGPIDWLELRLPEDQADALQSRDWGGLKVEIKAVACST